MCLHIYGAYVLRRPFLDILIRLHTARPSQSRRGPAQAFRQRWGALTS